MKKSKIIGLSILSVFLLCSLSYQPIIAEKQVIEIKENIDIVEKDNFDCESDDDWIPPFLCLAIVIRRAVLILLIFKFMYLPINSKER